MYLAKERFFFFEKTIDLQNVLNVPDIHINLFFFCSLLEKAVIKMTFEYDKLVLTRNSDFVGK